jgi:hypothetical protein
MKPTEIITGTSAVNEDGFAVIFCADPGYRYERYEIEGHEIRLVSDTKRAVESRTYGLLTCEALTAGAPLHIQTILPDGMAGELYALEG